VTRIIRRQALHRSRAQGRTHAQYLLPIQIPLDGAREAIRVGVALFGPATSALCGLSSAFATDGQGMQFRDGAFGKVVTEYADKEIGLEFAADCARRFVSLRNGWAVARIYRRVRRKFRFGDV
jgi:hypothetical protein